MRLLFLTLLFLISGCATYTPELGKKDALDKNKAYLLATLLAKSQDGKEDDSHPRIVLNVVNTSSGKVYGLHFRDGGDADSGDPVIIEVDPGVYRLDSITMAFRDFSGPRTKKIDQSNNIVVEAGNVYYLGNAVAVGWFGFTYGYRFVELNNKPDEAEKLLHDVFPNFSEVHIKNGFMFTD